MIRGKYILPSDNKTEAKNVLLTWQRALTWTYQKPQPAHDKHMASEKFQYQQKGAKCFALKLSTFRTVEFLSLVCSFKLFPSWYSLYSIWLVSKRIKGALYLVRLYCLLSYSSSTVYSSTLRSESMTEEMDVDHNDENMFMHIKEEPIEVDVTAVEGIDGVPTVNSFIVVNSLIHPSIHLIRV